MNTQILFQLLVLAAVFSVAARDAFEATNAIVFTFCVIGGALLFGSVAAIGAAIRRKTRAGWWLRAFGWSFAGAAGAIVILLPPGRVIPIAWMFAAASLVMIAIAALLSRGNWRFQNNASESNWADD